jgi:CDP-diacylglycerol--glycerol-3-phosphate 3-phosphatidyltransferase/cardiolipin synthase
VPNLLSGARVILAIAFPALDLALRPFVVAVAGLTDFADGFLARRMGLASWVGGLLDGVADKAFVLSVVITLASEGRLGVLAVVALLARDAVVACIAGWAAVRRRWAAFRAMPARPLGKATSACLFAAFLVETAAPDTAVAAAAIAAAGAASVAAATDYLLQLTLAPRPLP